MKTFKFLYLIAIVMFSVSPAFSVGTTVFDDTNGLGAWEYVGSGTALDGTNGNAEVAFEDLVTLISPANTNDYGAGGGSWGWDVAKFEPIGHILPNADAYVALRYEAPLGEEITGISIDELYLNVDVRMTVQIADADGNILAEAPRSEATEMVTDFSADGLNTSAIEIRWVNNAGVTIHVWASSVGVIVKTISVTTAAVEIPSTTEIFGSDGLVGWTTVGAGTILDTSDGQTKAFKDMAEITTPANTNDFGLDGSTWGWDAVRMNGPAVVAQPAAGAYVGVRYEAPAGKMILGVNIPKIYNSVATQMHVRIVDADGVIAAEMTPTAISSLNSLEATDIATSAIEIRWVNSHSWPINLWGTNNGVIFNTIEVKLADDPEYEAYDPIVYDNPAKPTKWFGYYHAHSDVGNWGNAFPDVGSFTNLNYVFPSVAAIETAAANHSYMLVDVMWHLFEAVEGGFGLRANLQANVDGLKVMFAGNEQYIGAITPIDEPYHRSVPQGDLEDAIAALREAFPGIAIYLNFAHTQVLPLTSETLPAGVDWYAFDLYESDGQPVQIADIQVLVDHLKSIKSVDQKLFLVPPSAMDLVADYTDQELADSINAFYGLMQSDAEIIGMMVFPSDGCRQDVFDGAGSTIPIALAAQQAIGAEIAGEVCGDVWNGYFKFDFNRDCRINLIDLAELAAKWVN